MMKWLRRLRGQRGQVIIMFVGIFTVITLMGAITIDFGLWLSERRGVQRAADAAALAGAQDLPTDDAAAIENAYRWAERNGYKDKDRGGTDGVTVTPELFCANTLSVPGICHANPCRKGDHCDSIRVTIRKKSAHLFSKMFDVGDVYVGFASAAGVEFETGPTDVVLVIDRSGSMGKEPKSGGQFRIYWAKLAANNFVDQLAGDADDLGTYRVAVVSFDGSGAATLHLDLASGTSASAVHAAINSVVADGSTYIAPALTTATDQLDNLGRADAEKVVILLSDGRNWANPEDVPPGQTQESVAAQRRADTIAAIPDLHDEADTVYSIGIGTEGSGPAELDEALLKLIAKAPGKYIHVEEAKDLPDIFERIAWKIAGRALTE